MALLDISSLQPHDDRARLVSIPSYKPSDDGDFVVYVILVKVGGHQWEVRRRFSEFAALDKERFAAYDQKSFLPPKRVGVLKTPAFLDTRRAELETYLRTVLELELWLQKKKDLAALPQPLAAFLKFPDFEVHGIVELLASQMAEKGEEWLATTHGETDKAKRKAFFQMHTYELFAVTERLKLPEPTSSSDNRKSDVGHVLDFLHRLPHLKIRGGSENLPDSDIPVNELPFSLQPLKALHTLWITDCVPDMISGISTVRKSVRFLTVLYTLHHLSEVLVDPDATPLVEDESGEGSSSSSLDLSASDCEDRLYADGAWPMVLEGDFSFNQLTEVDESITLLPRVQKLNLSSNRLADIGFHLQHLTRLRELDLSNNGLEKLELWHARLGNLQSLNLAGNSIRCLHGLSKLYSLEELNVQDNSIMSTSEGDVWSVGRLPCLNRLRLSGNPIESAVDYRSRVLESFGSRAKEKGSPRELDTVNVRLAIRAAKEEREKILETTRQQIGQQLLFLAEETLGRLSPEPSDGESSKSRTGTINTCDCCQD